MGRLSSIQYIWHMVGWFYVKSGAENVDTDLKLLMDAKNLATALEEQAASPGNEVNDVSESINTVA